MDFINKLSSREKTIFGLSGLALLGLLIHALVIEPYLEKQASLSGQLEQAIIDLRWMESVAHRLPAGTIPGQVVKFDGSLAKLIDTKVQSQKLGTSLAQMTPVGEDEIRVRFSDIGFNRLLNFIASVNSEGLSVKDLRINAGEKRGDVSASLVLKQNG